MGRTEIVKWFIKEAGVDINSKGGWKNRTPLIKAVSSFENYPDKWDLELVKWLVSNGADVNCFDDAGNTALHIASECGNMKAVQFFVKKCGMDPNIHNDEKGMSFTLEGETPINCAAYKGRTKIVKWFIKEAGVDINSKGGWCKRTPLHNAVGDSDCLDEFDLKLVKWLVENGADVNSLDNRGNTPLHLAAQNNSIIAVKYFIDEAGIDINTKGGPDWAGTPLHSAVYGTQFPDELDLTVVKWLVCHGADINCVDNDGDTVLHYAAQAGMLDVAKYFIEECHMNPGIKNCKTGKTPADDAKGDRAFVRYLHKKEKEYNGN